MAKGKSKGTKRARRSKEAIYKAVKNVTLSLAEKKCYESPAFDVTAPDVVIGTLASMAQQWYNGSMLNAIQQGTGFNQRVGNKIMVHYVQLTVKFIQVGTPAAANGQTMRYLVVKNTECQGQPTTGANFFAPISLSGSTYTTAGVDSLRDYRRMGAFRVLLDRQFNCQPLASGGVTTFTYPPAGVVQHYIPCKTTVNYTVAGTALQQSVSTSLIGSDISWMVCPSNAGCCQCVMSYRVVFTDT